MEWGTSKEKIVQKRYVGKKKLTHINFQSQESELFISKIYPYLGASPYGVIKHNFCSKGILENAPGLVKKG